MVGQVSTPPLPEVPLPPRTATVVVATYNRPEYVRTCLRHLQAQTVPPTEVIVVDASDSTETLDVVREFPGVTYLRNNRGPGHTATSRSIGLTAATGDVLAFLDDDAYADPDWLEQLLVRYDDPSVAAVGGLARRGQPGEESEGIGEIGLLLPNGRLTGFFAANPGRDVDVDHLIGANMSIRRSIANELGGIHDHYPGTCLREETDMLLRMRRAGYRAVYTPDAAVEHVAGPYARGRRFDLRYTYYGSRNHVVLLARTLGLRDRHTRRYVASAAVEVVDQSESAVRALLRRSGKSTRARFRAAGGGALRATALGAGLVVGTGTAVSLRLREGPVR